MHCPIRDDRGVDRQRWQIVVILVEVNIRICGGACDAHLAIWIIWG